MVATVTTCARGCIIPGAHRSDCTCTADGHKHGVVAHSHPQDEPCQDDICRWCDECAGGCLPRLASAGVLCQACDGRAARTLDDVPALVAWLRANVTPGTRAHRRDVLRLAPAPLDVLAVDDADDLHRTVCVWAARLRDELDLSGPNGIDLDAGRLPAGTAGAEAVAVVAWLQPLLGLMHARPWAGQWHDDLLRAHGEAHKHWPREDRTRKLPLPCPSCGRVMLHLHPPVTERADQMVMCHRDECGRRLAIDDYYLRAHQALAERKRTTSQA